MKKTLKKKTASPPKIPESVASLAGGMADDFNNILTTVMGACSLIDKDDPGNDELLQCVALIRSSAEHAADLSGRLMHIEALEQESGCTNCSSKDTGSAGASVRDKKDGDAIVSSTKKTGGTPS